MDQENRLCAICRDRTAEVFCPCTRPETFLCLNCVSPHMVKNKGKLHTTWTLDQLPYYNIPGHFERTQHRIEALAQVRELAWSSVGQVDWLIEQYTTETEQAIQTLQTQLYRTVADLNELKAELTGFVQSALQEVEQTLMDDWPQMRSQYGSAFRQLVENPQPVELFVYTKTALSLPVLAARVLPPEEIYRDKFASVYNNQVEVLDLRTQQISQHTISVNFSVGGSYLELDRNTLLCLGARPPSSAVYALNLLTFQLSPLPALSTPRNAPGVAKALGNIYAFGGFYPPDHLKSSEKCSLANKQWQPITSMHYARSDFTPCIFKNLIYLVDGKEHRTVESFCPLTETFTVLPISLPTRFACDSDTAAFVVNGELCLLTHRKQLARWEIIAGNEFRISKTDRACGSSQAPLIMNALVLIASSSNGKVEKFSLESYSFF